MIFVYGTSYQSIAELKLKVFGKMRDLLVNLILFMAAEANVVMRRTRLRECHHLVAEVGELSFFIRTWME